MALVECAECHAQISDKAATCPHCGAPVGSSTVPGAAVKPSKKKTHPVTWAVFALLILGAIWFFPKMQREANLPPLPIKVQYREALMGPGLVLKVTNTSNRHLSLLAILKNPSVNQEKTYRLDVAPNGTAEVGHLEGWALASGDRMRITHNDYQPWEGNIP